MTARLDPKFLTLVAEAAFEISQALEHAAADNDQQKAIKELAKLARLGVSAQSSALNQMAGLYSLRALAKYHPATGMVEYVTLGKP